MNVADDVAGSGRTGPGQGRLFAAASSRVCGSEPCPGGCGLPGSVPAAQVVTTVPTPAPSWVEVGGGVLPAGRWRPAEWVTDLWWMVVPVTTAVAQRFGVLP